VGHLLVKEADRCLVAGTPSAVEMHPTARGSDIPIRLDENVEDQTAARKWPPPRYPDQPAGMVVGMATRKVTVTLDADQLDRIRTLVGSGAAPSVSGFVQHAVGVALDDIAGWGTVLADALDATGGELSAEERRWADQALGNKGRRGSSAA